VGEEKLVSGLYLNASLDLKVITWLGHKTGSTSMVNILNEIGFKYYKFHNGVFELVNNKPLRAHGCYPNQIPDDFKIIASFRNPFSQLVSEYKYQSIENYESYLMKLFEDKDSLNCFIFKTRFPDYIVRMENMFEDYSQIEFITESKFYKSGLLKRFTKFKMNENPWGLNNWKDYYNENLAKVVVDTFPYHFSKYYDENSWR